MTTTMFSVLRRKEPTQRWFKKIMLVLLLALPLTAALATSAQGTSTQRVAASNQPPREITGFGSNQGQLKMFKYVPDGLGPSVPLVVALHGCTQQASNYDDETGWVKYADAYKFVLLLPQETVNPMKCFRWFDSNHNERDKGEALSIKQMIDKMRVDHPNIDPKRIYVTGLSAGGAMTAVMLATYPDIFAGGGIIAGVPYKCANSLIEAGACGVGKDLLKGGAVLPVSPPNKGITPAHWANKVRSASSFIGPFPRVSIWHGDRDGMVNRDNETELMEQWTGVHRIDQTKPVTNTLNGGTPHPVIHQVFMDAAGNKLVETYLVNGMDHATPVNPGPGNEQCGKVAPFISDVGICSSFYIGKFWGVIK